MKPCVKCRYSAVCLPLGYAGLVDSLAFGFGGLSDDALRTPIQMIQAQEDARVMVMLQNRMPKGCPGKLR